jgi:pimeloyl-ACP methyl ester carboxylesterase
MSNIEFTMHRTLSDDGTAIEYLVGGSGTVVALVPGALAVAADLLELAGLLAGTHTVVIMQRRGRGGSGPQGRGYSMERECEDLAAVCAATGARLLFGHSFGGLVALQYARRTVGVIGTAVYEPGVSEAGSIPTDWIARAQKELDRGDPFSAFITFVRGINPAQTGRVPRLLLRGILRRAIPADELAQKLALMPQCLREHRLVAAAANRTNEYRGVSAATLVLQGSKGIASGRRAALVNAIPVCEYAELPGLDHFAPEQHAAPVARKLLAFFAEADARVGRSHDAGN